MATAPAISSANMEVDPSRPVGETQATYDLITTEYARLNAAAWSNLADQVNAVTASLPPDGVVADVGCGPGRDIALFRAGGFRVIGIDLSFGQLRTSNLTGVVQADMRRLPLRRNSVDAIWCHAALLHIPRMAVPAVLAEFARATRPGGELFLAVAEGDGEGFEVASRYGSDRRRWFTLHREPDLTALLAEAGFAVYRTSRNRERGVWLSIHARLGVAEVLQPDKAADLDTWLGEGDGRSGQGGLRPSGLADARLGRMRRPPAAE